MTKNGYNHLSEMALNDAAQNMIKRYGVDAYQEANHRAEELLSLYDKEGYIMWAEIAATIQTLLNQLH